MSNNPVGQTCPYCQFPIKPDEQVLYCTACKLPHHAQCWHENGKCTTFGCEGSASAVPTSAYQGANAIGNSNENRIDLTHDTVVCPRCNSNNTINATFCTHCGTNLSEAKNNNSTVFCRHCGARNIDTNNACIKCGSFLREAAPVQAPPAPNYNYSYQPQPAPAGGPVYSSPPPYGAPLPPNIDNHMFFAIFVTVFCCLPTGIAAIIYASKVNGKMQAGDYAGAIESANSAKTWSWISLGAGILIGFLALVGG